MEIKKRQGTNKHVVIVQSEFIQGEGDMRAQHTLIKLHICDSCSLCMTSRLQLLTFWDNGPLL